MEDQRNIDPRVGGADKIIYRRQKDLNIELS